MTAHAETSKQTPALAMAHNYQEDPGVKKLAKGYKLLPKETLSGLGGDLLGSLFLTFMITLIIAAIVYVAAWFFNISTLWATVVILLLGAALFTWLMQPVISWVFNARTSPLVINKRHRTSLKETRRLVAQLGESVVPVLTEDHIIAIQRVREDLHTAIVERGLTTVRRYPNDYDRITVLLLEDLNRESLLRDIITNRGITTMDEIEEVLRNIEENTIAPLQSGWL